jgi:predicted nucleic acid-binding protein
MTTSLDTNVLVYLLNEDSALNQRAFAGIERSRKAGRLLVSGPVYAELLGLPSRTQLILDEFFTRGSIEVDWRFDEAAWRAAGVAFQSYVRRRVKSTGELPRRILADFMIGAHTMNRGYTLLTTDKRLYEVSFPGIRVESI